VNQAAPQAAGLAPKPNEKRVPFTVPTGNLGAGLGSNKAAENFIGRADTSNRGRFNSAPSSENMLSANAPAANKAFTDEKDKTLHVVEGIAAAGIVLAATGGIANALDGARIPAATPTGTPGTPGAPGAPAAGAPATTTTNTTPSESGKPVQGEKSAREPVNQRTRLNRRK
jgi:hypothetical protein